MYHAQTSRLIKLAAPLLVTTFLAACGGGGGESETATDSSSPNNNNAGYSTTAVHTTAVTNSAQCPNGGIQIHTGVDVDQSGILEQDEVTNTQELCHMDAERVLARAERLAPGTACSHGGNRLTIGYDQNGNEQIDTEEVNQTLHLCDQDTLDNLAIAVFRDAEEPEGENCAYGGLRKSVGIDRNSNGTLDETEITSSQYQCRTNHEISLTPYSYYDYCTAFYCNITSYNDRYLLLQGVTGIKTIGRIFDDGLEDITITTNSGAPDWLEFSLSEPNFNINNNIYFDDEFPLTRQASYDILVDQSAIPASAVGQTFNVTLTLSDGVSSVTLAKELKIVAPIFASFEEESLEFIESGDGSSQTAFVKVNFSKPLPSGSVAQNESYYGRSVYLQRYRLADDNEQPTYPSYHETDFSISWLSSDFFAGQTQATVMINVNDDSLPEDTENYRIVLDFPDHPDEELFFVQDSMDLSIEDDESDVPIVATVTMTETSVTEDGATEEASSALTTLPFTINFSPAIPANGTLTLRLSRPNSSESVTSDLGFECEGYYSSPYLYCDSSVNINLVKGATSYTGEIQIIRDANKEPDESFVLTLGADSSFLVENVTTSFTVVDDDAAPEIGFTRPAMDAYYQSRLIFVPIALENTTSENVVFSVSGTTGDTAVEGVHYDFGVSQPVSMTPGKTTFNLPILLHGAEFSGSSIEMNLQIEAESGATVNPDSSQIRIILDKIEPYAATLASFTPPLSGSYEYSPLDREALFMDHEQNVYLTGTIRNGAALEGFVSSGSDDVFISKFDLDGNHLWSQQFGNGSNYSANFQFDAKTGTALHVRYSTITRINANGVRSTITLNGNYDSQLPKFRIDADQNLYVLRSTYHYYYDEYDHDNDGSTSNILLAKYNAANELLWSVEDFTDIQSGHESVYLNYPTLELNAAGVPYLMGSTRYTSTLLGQTILGSSDYVSFTFSPETGTVQSFHRFGTDGYEYNEGLRTVSYKDDQVLTYYAAEGGATIGGTSVGATERVVQVVFNADGSIQSEQPVNWPVLGNMLRSPDDSYFYLSSQYYYSTALLYRLNEELEPLAFATNLFNYTAMANEPIPSDDGGYYLTTREWIRKVTPNLNIRQ